MNLEGIEQWLSKLSTIIDGLPHLDPQLLPPSFSTEVLNPVQEERERLTDLEFLIRTHRLILDLACLSGNADGKVWFFWEEAGERLARFVRAESTTFFRVGPDGRMHKIHPLHSEEDAEDHRWPEAETGLVSLKEPDVAQTAMLKLDYGNLEGLALKFQNAHPAPLLHKPRLEGLNSMKGVLLPLFARHFPDNAAAAKVKVLTIREDDGGRQGILGRDPTFLSALDALEQAAHSDATVYLRGESGTGKELFAKHLHELSPRGSGPFVPINCSAIPTELIESEMFGHEKGAFTGAYYRKIGKVEQAHGGTLFLDEIGEMPLAFQAKLLRYLQEKKFTRVGGNQSVHSDARIVVATHRDLKEMVAHKAFREDLYYRIHVIPVTIPPLRERGGDIRELSEMFFNRFIAKSRASRRKVDETTFDALERYPFPGNVRELENIIQRTVVMTQKPVISAEDLPDEIHNPADEGEAHSFRLHPFEKYDRLVPNDRDTLKVLKKEVDRVAFSYQRDLDRRFLLHLMEQSGGSARKAAELASINRTLFYKLLKRAGLDIGLLQRGD